MVRLVSSLLVYPVGILCLATLYRQSLLLAAVLVGLAVIVVLIAPREGDVVVLLGGAVLGPIAEIVAVRFGAWSYHTPDFLGVPIWLPIAWGLATLIIKRIGEGVLELRRR